MVCPEAALFAEPGEEVAELDFGVDDPQVLVDGGVVVVGETEDGDFSGGRFTLA